ncbi:MAG: hypothetical protein WEE64_14170 [Dehalococcoidia bacterium]
MWRWLNRIAIITARFTAGLALWVAAGLGLAIFAGSVIVAALLLWVVFLYDDPEAFFAVAEDAVAEHLCPEAHDQVKAELIATEDSGVYYVYVRSSPEVTNPSQISARDTLAEFYVVDTPEEPLVQPGSQRSRSFVSSVRAACENGGPPWPQLADR